ncbi:enoyl-CoA hydratase/isomerase family protein [Desulforegula conservatrix]|uniref:enoyl-CoA hydratase/isomerase family protein n=1 Tax=Desulforegula conservatrix TaxID=153026 RepID=UPI00041B3871|nr:enoyl-CoA hydratase-related protein [Desulforegula conservatrix]
MELTNVLLDKKNHVAIVTINRPSANSWNLGAMEDFQKVLDDVEADKNVRVVIITGAGDKCFSAGFDVSDAGNAVKTAAMGRDLWRRVDRFPKPVIAAMNGHALGGGLELALCCHFRIMANDNGAKTGLTELNLGIIPGWGGTQRLMMATGKQKALDMILFGHRLSAEEALAAGMLNDTAPVADLMNKAMDLATKLAARPPLAVTGVLKAMSAGIYEGVDAGLKVEEEMSNVAMNSKDAVEGFTAFLEKRPAVFTGE